MKLLILLAALAVSRGAKLDRNYLPPTGSSNSGGSGLLETPKLSRPGDSGTPFGHQDNFRSQNQPSFNSGPSGRNDDGQNGFDSGIVNAYENQNYEEDKSRPERPQAALDRNAGTLREENENNGEAFSFLFETENGIYAEESGVATNGVQAQGGYSYTGDDGQVYSITYTADENGFVPQGEHLPTAPPVPEDILRALEQNAKDEAAGIFDDGSYDESKYADDDYIQQKNQIINGNFQDPFNIQRFALQGNDENTIATQAAAYLPPRENLQRNPSGTFRSTGNGPAVPNGPTNFINNAITSQAAAYLPPHRGSFGRSSQSQRIPSGGNEPNAYRNIAQNEFAAHSRSEHNSRPSSYEVPLQSRTPVQRGPDAQSNGFGARTQNSGGRPTRPSFNDRTGYNY